MDPIFVPLIAGAIALFSRDLPADRVLLLPQADGRPSAVVITSAGGSTVLDQPWSGASVSRSGRIDTAAVSDAAARQRYADALAAQPPRPTGWTVYFVSAQSDRLTPESLALLERIKRELALRPAPEIAVIGHADRVGSVADNDALSLQRAQFVRQALIEVGIDAALIEPQGRGEREPAVITPDGTAEARNRRVDIIVR